MLPFVMKNFGKDDFFGINIDVDIMLLLHKYIIMHHSYLIRFQKCRFDHFINYCSM